ncbi:ABC transporter permease [Succinivibrio dextrinosolvens]|uniref:ABC transporter permease n=1 Tax=Succinivibrio dextrinosolvens TaxID=83771 RepID=UPI001924D703|nr:ABC transporter permease [Succinivibrio dextrinosolvens]
MMNKYRQAIFEEFEAMMGGHFIPYHIAAFMMAILTTLIFSLIMTHATVFEGKIAVIDLDATNYSTSLVESLNTSSYVEITEVYHTPLPVDKLLEHDRNIGVLYIPKGLEKAISRSDLTFNIGYLADYSNLAQNGQALSNLQKIINEIAAQSSGTKIAISQGLAEDGAKAMLMPMHLVDRDLYNPTMSSTINICSAFIYFFSSILLGLTCLMLVGRLKVTNRWQNVLENDVTVLIARLIPYALIYTTAITLVTSAIVVFGQLRFSGNYFFHLPSIFMTAMAIGMMALIFSWTTNQPGEGGSRMILLVPPGFIMGGALMASGTLPDWVNTVKYCFPLTWEFEIWRDFAYRGIGLSSMIGTYGKFLMYLTVLGGILYILHYRAAQKDALIRQNTKIIEKDMNPES